MTIARSAVPVITIDVEDASVLEYAAVPTLRFSLRLQSAGRETIRSLVLDTMIRVAAPRRCYDAAERERLKDLFGAADQWRTSLRSLPWTQTTLFVPPFIGDTRVDLPVTCTYDFEAGVVSYFRALEEGDIPLEFLFAGTIFYAGDGGMLQTVRISWDTEAEFRLPVGVWQRLIDHYYAGSAWLRLRRDTAERLSAYRTRHTLATLDDAIDALLAVGGERGDAAWTR